MLDGKYVIKSVSAKTLETAVKKLESQLESITLPNDITKIEYNTFYGKSIVIPESVETIKSWAFDRCTALDSITITNPNTTIEEDAFRGCTSLKCVSGASGAKLADTITDGVLSMIFNREVTQYTVPERTSRISFEAFVQTPALSEIHGKKEHLERVLPESRRKYIVDAN